MKDKLLNNIAKHIFELVKIKNIIPHGAIGEAWDIVKFVIAPSLGLTAEEARFIVATKIAALYK